MKGLRLKCENFKEENEDLRSTAKAATTDQQFHYLTFLRGSLYSTADRGSTHIGYFVHRASGRAGQQRILR